MAKLLDIQSEGLEDGLLSQPPSSKSIIIDSKALQINMSCYVSIRYIQFFCWTVRIHSRLAHLSARVVPPPPLGPGTGIRTRTQWRQRGAVSSDRERRVPVCYSTLDQQFAMWRIISWIPRD